MFAQVLRYSSQTHKFVIFKCSVMLMTLMENELKRTKEHVLPSVGPPPTAEGVLLPALLRFAFMSQVLHYG